MVVVSESAVEHLKNLIQEQGLPEAALRVAVVPGGAGGVQYMLSLEEAPNKDDVIIDENGVRILMDEGSASLLDGAEIDYMDGLMRSGFTINNPNIAPSGGEGGCACGGHCGCGGH